MKGRRIIEGSFRSPAEGPNLHVHCVSAYLKLTRGNGDAKEEDEWSIQIYSNSYLLSIDMKCNIVNK
jgi:hypothetical protein